MKTKPKYTLDMLAPVYTSDHTYIFKVPTLNLPKCKTTIIIDKSM